MLGLADRAVETVRTDSLQSGIFPVFMGGYSLNMETVLKTPLDVFQAFFVRLTDSGRTIFRAVDIQPQTRKAA